MTAKIWVDADACPVVIRDILIKSAQRTKVVITFVANHSIPLPKLSCIQFRQVGAGFDIADNWIVKNCESNDLVITQDIPLAAEVIAKGCLAMTPRGVVFTAANIRQRLSMRDFMETMRSSGIQTGGPSAFHARDKQTFGNKLDQWLQKNIV
jgi:uncharacterized protein YaiI (UPF0178 family)